MVFLIFFIGLFLKIALAFSLPVYHDVGWYISLLEYHDSAFMNLIVLEHPPFGYYPYLLFMSLFGMHDFVLRFVPLIFGLLELLLVYLIAKKWFGRRTADCTIILFSLFYFAAINTLSPEGDGSIMGFFSLLFFYCISAYYDLDHLKDYTKKKPFLFHQLETDHGKCDFPRRAHFIRRPPPVSARVGLQFPRDFPLASKISAKPLVLHQWKIPLLLAGLFLGILLLIKVRAVLFFIPCILYSCYKTRNFFRSFKDLFVLGIISVFVFAIFPLQVFIANPEPQIFITLLEQVILHNTATFSLLYKLLHPLLFLQVFIVLTFLSFFLFFRGIMPQNNRTSKIFNNHIHPKQEKLQHDKIVLLLFWFLSFFFMLLTILPEGLSAAYPRYIAFLLPPLLLLCGRGLASLPLENKDLFLIFISGLSLGLFFLFLNQQTPPYWFFETASMGIVKVSKLIIAFTFILSGLLLL
ncbi:MAG: glycosyltransferase family 39 protein, partial [Nanoarchaeota archaeon]